MAASGAGEGRAAANACSRQQGLGRLQAFKRSIFAVGGQGGAWLGGAYTLFTWLRLVHFTLNQEASDTGCFQGIPSTLGAVIVLSALLVLDQEPLLLGAAIGVACVKMVAFSTLYRHLGRWLLGSRPAVGIGAAGLALALVLSWVQQPKAAGTVVLVSTLAYAIWPSIKAMKRAFTARSAGELSRDPSAT